MAVRTHPTVEAARDLRKAAEEGLTIARSGFYPTIDARVSAGYGRTNNSSTRVRTTRAPGGPQSITQDRYESLLTITQMLFDGAATHNLSRAAQSRLDATAFQVFDAGEIIGLRAAVAYLDVMRNRLLVELAEANAQKHEDVVGQIRERADAGGGSQADVDQAAGRRALALSTQLAAVNALRDAQAAYLEAVGEAPSDLARPLIEAAVVPDTVETAVSTGVAANPAVAAASENARAAAAEYRATAAPYLPRFDLELSGRRDENTGGIEGPNSDVQAKVVMTYNLYRGGADRARRTQALALYSEAQEREAEIRRLVEQAVRIAYNGYSIARDRVEVLESHVASSQRALAAYYEQFNLGNRTLLDVLNVENEVFTARTNLVNGEFAVISNYYRVLAALGQLLRTLDVAAGAEERPPVVPPGRM